MADTAALQRLLTWLSPAFPVGTFAWSQGLETATATGRVADAASLKDWIGGSLAHGALKTDAILLAHAYRGETDATKLAELAELGLALTAASERHFETSLTGETFGIAARAWPRVAPPRWGPALLSLLLHFLPSHPSVRRSPRPPRGAS